MNGALVPYELCLFYNNITYKCNQSKLNLKQEQNDKE